MRTFFQKITAITLVGLLLLSTISFTVEKHYCGRFLVDIAVFSEAKGCGMEKIDPIDDDHIHELVFKKVPCCKDEIIVLEGQDDLITSLKLQNISKQIFLSPFVSDRVVITVFKQQKLILTKEYSPPDLVKDIPILHERFLI